MARQSHSKPQLCASCQSLGKKFCCYCQLMLLQKYDAAYKWFCKKRYLDDWWMVRFVDWMWRIQLVKENCNNYKPSMAWLIRKFTFLLLSLRGDAIILIVHIKHIWSSNKNDTKLRNHYRSSHSLRPSCAFQFDAVQNSSVHCHNDSPH